VVLRGPLALPSARPRGRSAAARRGPRELRVVDALPLLASGKIDRMALQR
jgi:acyl-coenzyme A synthetase/AMP-(fatty) acid ligase